MLAVTTAGLLPEAHYPIGEAVSSQTILRHDQPAISNQFVHDPSVVKVVPTATVTKVAEPILHVTPTPFTYATASPVTYHTAHYSPGEVISQNVFHHDHPHTHLIPGSITKIDLTSPFQYTNGPLQYTPVTKVIQPVKIVRPVTKVFEPIKVIQPVTKVIEPVKIIRPVTKVVEPVKIIRPVTKVIEPVNVIRPVTKYIQPVKVIQPVTKVIEPFKVIRPITEVIRPVTKFIKPVDKLVLRHEEQYVSNHI